MNFGKQKLYHQIPEYFRNALEFQERIRNFHQSIDTWRFDIFLNLSNFKDNNMFLLKYIGITKTICDNMIQISCSNLYRELVNREGKIREKLQELYDLYPSTRIKRDFLIEYF